MRIQKMDAHPKNGCASKKWMRSQKSGCACEMRIQKVDAHPKCASKMRIQKNGCASKKWMRIRNAHPKSGCASKKMDAHPQKWMRIRMLLKEVHIVAGVPTTTRLVIPLAASSMLLVVPFMFLAKTGL